MNGSTIRPPRPAFALALGWMIAACFAPRELVADPEKLPAGRFLYAGDDDWDWLSPLGATEPSKLARYGAMPWSALDWAEEGLAEVRGVLVGEPPHIGKYLTMEELSEIRGKGASYERRPQIRGKISEVLGAERSPNVVIFMQCSGRDGKLDDGDIAALVAFVEKGGRLVVLDDWQRYPDVLEAFLESALEWPNKLRRAGGEEKPEKEAELPEVADPEFVERVAGLVKDLGSPEFRAREAAMRELRELGLPAIELADEMRPEDPEIAARLMRLRSRFVREREQGGSSPVDDERRRAKHAAVTEHILGVASKLEAARFPYRVADVYVDKEGAAIPALRMTFPAP